MELQLDQTCSDVDANEDDTQSNLVIDAHSDAESLSSTYACDRDAQNSNGLVMELCPTAQEVDCFQPASYPGITSLDHTRDDRNNNNRSILIDVALTAPRRPLLPTLRTPLQWRRPAEQYPNHQTEDLQLTSTRRVPPLRTPSYLQGPPERYTGDDSASEDEAPKPMSRYERVQLANRYQRLRLDDRYRHSQLNDLRPNNHCLDNLPPTHMNPIPTPSFSHQNPPSLPPKDDLPESYAQPSSQNNQYDDNTYSYNPDYNHDNHSSSDLNHYTSGDLDHNNDDQVENFEDHQFDQEACYDMNDDGGCFDYYDEDY
ncbi:hypothetical protein PTTG_09987 [Puccinia triticina 1-1 BBBD Race 1]|uniref:Uncharacterized protein n=1 Tax=Puccinia triticina (isolate 1-1 / race 1 (BBBD)) TaxID=630390 RepID=A0A0C4F9V2_PUCT1|nr:hypothetical protein PTTG_09987 [Puccinia triticina 1-1 BBBD Race 1]